MYKAPNERIDGRAIIVSTAPTKKDTNIPIKRVKKTLKKKEKSEINQKPKKILIINNDIDSENENEYKIDENIIKIIELFKKNGITILDKLNEKQLSLLLRELNKSYFNQKPLMSDSQYDIIKEYMGITLQPQSNRKKSLQQEIYCQLRRQMDSSIKEFNKKQNEKLEKEINMINS